MGWYQFGYTLFSQKKQLIYRSKINQRRNIGQTLLVISADQLRTPTLSTAVLISPQMFCFASNPEIVLFFFTPSDVICFLPTHRKFPFFCHGSYMLVIKSSGPQQEKTGSHCWNDECFQPPPPGRICARFTDLAQAAALKADFFYAWFDG